MGSGCESCEAVATERCLCIDVMGSGCVIYEAHGIKSPANSLKPIVQRRGRRNAREACVFSGFTHRVESTLGNNAKLFPAVVCRCCCCCCCRCCLLWLHGWESPGVTFTASSEVNPLTRPAEC